MPIDPSKVRWDEDAPRSNAIAPSSIPIQPEAVQWDDAPPARNVYPGTNETVREDPGLGQYLLNRLKAGVITPVAGAFKNVADTLAPDLGTLSPNVQQLVDVVLPQRRAGAVIGREADIAQEIAADYRNVGAPMRPQSVVEAIKNPADTLRYYGGIGAESAPTILAALATRNPTLANVVASGGTVAQSYGDLRQDPRANIFDALRESTIAGITEGAGGRAAFESAFAPTSLGRKVLTTSGLEALGESGSEAAQTATPALTGREDVPILAIIRAAIDAGIVGTATGAGEAVLGSRGDVPPSNEIAPTPTVENTVWDTAPPVPSVGPAPVAAAAAPAPIAPPAAAMPTQPVVAEGAGTPMAAPAGEAPLPPDLDIDAILAALPPDVITQLGALTAPNVAAPVTPQEGQSSAESWTNRGSGQSRANESSSAIENTAGGIYLEARSGPDDANPLQMWVTKDGSLQPRQKALSAEGENVNLWQDGTPEQKAAVLDLLRKRNESPVGSAERKAIDAQVKEIVTATQQPEGERNVPPSEALPAAVAEQRVEPVPAAAGARVAEAQAQAREEGRQEGGQEDGAVTYTAADFMPGMGREVGWSQRGGELMRERREGDDSIENFAGRATGDVTGRTTWVAKPDPSGGESRLWRSRPDRSLNEGQAQTALEKAARGEKLRPIEQRFVDYATALAGEYAETANRESAAYRAELEQYSEADRVAQRQAARDEFGELADADADEALALDDLVHRAYAAGAQPEAILDATFDGTPAEQARNLWRMVAELESADATVPEATQRDRAVGAEAREEGRAPRPQPSQPAAGLFGAPSSREVVDAEARRRDAERDGRTGTGRTDMASGAGDLFAGRRPQQATIEEPAQRPTPVARTTSSWVLRNKETGEVIAETFDRRKVDALNTAKYEAVPINEYLASLNARPEALEDVTSPRDLLMNRRAEREAERATLPSEESRARGEREAADRGVRAAVEKALGPLKSRVEFVADAAGLPDNLRRGVEARLAARGGRGKTAAVYDQSTGKVYMLTDANQSVERAVFTAFHELAGHHGLRTLLGDKLDPALGIARQNPTVRSVADAIAAERNIDQGSQKGILLATEEALAELAAAVRTGNYAEIESRYKTEVPEGVRASLKRAVDNFLKRLKAMLDDIFGRHVFTDEDVRALLEHAWQAANEGPTIADVRGGMALEQTAFHGTPHEVDRFSLQKIGTGEGAQAFGWGLYFAGKRSVAEHYRDRLTESNAPVHTVTIRGKRVAPDSPEGHGARLVFHNSKPEMKRLAKQMLADAKAGDAYAVETAKAADMGAVEYYQRVANTIDDLKKSDVKVHRGRLYEVDIPEDSDLVDNEAPIAKQNDKVKDIARQLLIDEGYLREGQNGDRQLASAFKEMGRERGGMVRGPDGQLLYELLSKKLGSEQAASQYLNEHGIPGLKYKAGQIVGGRTNEGHNYVIWDEAAISDPQQILESVESMTPAQTAREAAKLPDDATGQSIIAGGQVVPFLAAAKEAGADLTAVAAALRNTDPAERARELVKAIDAILPSLREEAVPAPKAAPKPAPRPSTGTRNEITDAERAAAGRDPILRDAVQTNEQTLAEAMRTLKEDPAAGPETVEKLIRSGPAGVSLADEAVLLVHKTDLRNRRDTAAQKLADPNASEEAKAVAKREWESLEAQIATLDEAAVASGREWGRLGQFRQRMLRDDFTFEALERKERARLERPLTPAESQTIRDMAQNIASLQRRADAAEAQLANAASVSTYDDLIKRMADSMQGKKRPTLARLKEAANESRAALAKLESVPSRKGQSGATINPVAFYHLSRIGAYHVANGAATFADWVDRMRADIGDAIETFRESLPEIFRASKVQADKPLAAGATVAEVLAKVDRANITPKDVRRLVEAHVGEGMRGEAKVMAAVAEDLGIDVDQARKLFVQTNPRTPQTLTEAQQELRDLRRLVTLQAEIDRLEAGLPRDRMAQKVEVSGEVQAKKDELAALRKKLRADRSEMRAAQREAERPIVDPEARYQVNRGKDIARRIETLQKRIAAGDFAATPRVPRALNAANDKAQFELSKAKQDFLRHQFEDNLRNRTPVQKLFGGVKDTLNLARAMMTSLDLSGVLRQGGFITYGHPVRAAKSLVPMLKAFASEGAQHKVQREIENRANAPLYRKYGLELTGIGSGPLSQIEEAYASRWLDRLPRAVGGGLVRGSGRAYTTFLNKLRADSFDAMVASLAKGQTPTPEEGKAIANFINVATGRGKIGAKANAGEALNTIFFAPRLVASRFQLLAGQPLYGGSARTRGMIAQEYARFLAGVGVVTALAALALGDDEEPEDRLKLIGTDPRSANFGKIRFGNTYLDPLAGLAQASTLLARLTTGETVTQKGDVRPLRANYTLNDLQRALGADIDPHKLNKDGSLPFGSGSAADVIGRFLRTKLAPVPGAAVNTLSGENLIGEPVTPLQAAGELVTPMSIGNVREAMEEQGIPKGTAITLLGLLGMGVQYRKPKDEEGK